MTCPETSICEWVESAGKGGEQWRAVYMQVRRAAEADRVARKVRDSVALTHPPLKVARPRVTRL